MAIDRITCCYQCPDRFPGCHGSCEKYIQQKAEFDKAKAEVRKKKDIEVGLTSCLCDRINKSVKKNHHRRGH